MSGPPLTRIAVLASGGGSNLQALLDFLATLGTARGGEVVLVASDRPSAGALDRARAAHVHTAILQPPRTSDEDPLAQLLDAHDIQLLVLAGYLKLVPHDVTRRFAGRIVNVHPAPLPRFGGAGMYGHRAHVAVLGSGATLSGPTVHLVDEVYDRGAVIAHWPVPVLRDDDARSLASRVLRAEHLLLPRVVQAMASGDLRASGTGELTSPFFCRGHALPTFDDTLDDATLGALLDAARAV